jgi:glucose/arabinose dehydrogenase
MVRGGWLQPVSTLVVGALVFSMLFVLWHVPRAEGAETLPRGFVLRDTPTGQGTYNLTDFAYLPDGSVLTTGKNGRVTWVPEDGGPRTIAELTVETTADLGLVGIAVSPDYSTTGHVYLSRALPGSHTGYLLRLSRFTVKGGSMPSALAEERVLLDIPTAAPMHAMTGIVADTDKTLWVSIGDLQRAGKVYPDALRAMKLGQPAGKLLHITASGAGVPSNPHYNASRPRSWRSRVYARGFRSPFRFSLDPRTGTPIVGDVGWRSKEEVNLVMPGRDYKWPCWEGPIKTPGYSDLEQCGSVTNTPPLWSYNHGSGSGQGNSVTGGVVYTGKSYPATYRGAYFFGDYTGGKIWTMRFDANGRLVTPPQDPPFGVGIGGPVKFAAAANGDIVYADIFSGSLRRLSYSPGNTQPVAKVATTTDPSTRTVTFDAGESVDYDGDALAYEWDFGDGSSGHGKVVSHRYTTSGETFEAFLTVTDPLGSSDKVSVIVAPSNRTPTLMLTTPGVVKFAVGEVVRLSASAVDPEDGPLTVRWTSTLMHCAESTTCHAHPGPESTGADWSGTFPDHPDTSLQVTATVQDSAGVHVSRSFTALPREHRLTLVSTTPAVLSIPAESASTTAMVTEGARVDVVAGKHGVDGVAAFERWADGPTTRTRTVRMGSRDIRLTATYLTPIDRRYRKEPALRSMLGAPVSPEVAVGRIRYRQYQRGRVYWSARHGVHEVHGKILKKFRKIGGHAAVGVPVSDQKVAGTRAGRYNDFSKGASIYWTRATGAHVIRGDVRRAWRRLDAENGVLGYPAGDIRETRKGKVKFVHFDKLGSIYWSKRTGAHEVYGPIRARWRKLGAARSRLGLPTSGVRTVRGGLRSEFQRGYIFWDSSRGTTTVGRRRP